MATMNQLTRKTPHITCICRTRARSTSSIRTIATSAAANTSPTTPVPPHQKREGDISAAFASLSGVEFGQLEPRFADLKTRLITGHEDAVKASWDRLLATLRTEVPAIAAQGSRIIPEIDFAELQPHRAAEPSAAVTAFRTAVRKHGVAVVRNVVSPETALGWKHDLQAYIAANPQTRAFPPHDPQVYELYWSRAQLAARAHPNLLETQKFLMGLWQAHDPAALVSTAHPVIYADRLRMRQPGDATFALGPHVDGGSCERWEENGYGLGGVYDDVFRGRWEDFDAWEAGRRLPVNMDLYQGVGACSMFRMYQGWLSMSHTGPNEGTLLVNPLFSRATAYFLLRPFFSPTWPATDFAGGESDAAFLASENWTLDPTQSSWLQGATPGHGQELRPHLHPHLALAQTMVHVPRVRPGDYVAWHCDTIHAVDPIHAGTGDASVMYIPACPLTVGNAAFAARQRAAFLEGTPCPDFGGGVGESQHVGRTGAETAQAVSTAAGLRAFGLQRWDPSLPGLTSGQRHVMEKANQELGFDA